MNESAKSIDIISMKNDTDNEIDNNKGGKKRDDHDQMDKDEENDNNRKKIKTSYYDDNYIQEEGICCFCGNECDIMSQSCGSCARQYTMRLFGWK